MSRIVNAQSPEVARIQPDVLAPGMSAAVEILSRIDKVGSFGSDGVYQWEEKIVLVNKADTNRIIIGPVIVSWNGRVIQMALTVLPNSPTGSISFQIRNGQRMSTLQRFEIRTPQASISIVGSGILGDQLFGTGTLSNGNTLLVEELDLRGIIGGGLRDKITMSLKSPDPLLSGNPRYNPFIILVRKQIRLTNIELSVSADSINGGPGGGGGGAGLAGAGGTGYTGGGSDSVDNVPAVTNIGSGGGPSIEFGGPSLTGVPGGRNDYADQGGGGGTGIPFGKSGNNGGQHSSSPLGGFGAGSAGGEEPGIPYGGGGGGFAEPGLKGGGIGNNGGRASGGRFVIPLQGGSGGGGGNCYECTDSLVGSGGGGGGAITIVSYESISLTNAAITANGSRGSKAHSKQASGGGGGSGGAIILAARDTIQFQNAQLQAAGGVGGMGGPGIEDEARGGNGGIGFIRTDGVTIEQTTPSIIGKNISGPTLLVPSTPSKGPIITLRGTAGTGDEISDTVRIYYRTVRTKWTHIDTAVVGNRWQKDIPLDVDSTLYVTVIQKVRSPKRDTGNYEPEFVMSHLSSGIIKVIPRVLLAYSDTLKLGCTRLNNCISGFISLANKGGKTAFIDSVRIIESRFTITSKPATIQPYSFDSIVVEYCPKEIGTIATELLIYERDTIARIIVMGCGTDRDERIQIRPSILDFGKIDIDSCRTRIAVITSVGEDSVTFFPESLSSGAFTVLQPLSPIRLGKNQSDTLRIRFCAADTGEFHGTFIITQQRDSILTTGYGLLKELVTEDTIRAGDQCLGNCFVQEIQVSSTGNDTVRIDSLHGARLLTPTLPINIFPTETKKLLVEICTDVIDKSHTSISYSSNAKQISPTTILYTTRSPLIMIRDSVAPSTICFGICDTIHRFLYNPGNESVMIDSVWMKSGTAWTVSQISTPRSIAAKDSISIELYYCPTVKGLHHDTLFIRSFTNECDTTLPLSLEGVSTMNEPIFSRNEIDFGIVDTGRCTVDSLLIENHCHGEISLSINNISNTFHILESQQPLTISGNSVRTIRFEFCPVDSSEAQDEVIFQDAHFVDYSVLLKGRGKVQSAQKNITLSLPTMTAVANSAFYYPVYIDSLSAPTLLDTLQFRVTYDPSVVSPLSIINSMPAANITASEPIIGEYDVLITALNIQSRGELCRIEMLPLLSMKTSTVTTLQQVHSSPLFQTTTKNGFIAVERCAEPPKNLVIPGDFFLTPPIPNPIRATGKISVKMGTSGVLSLRLYDASGSLIWDKHSTLTEGYHTLTISAESLPSGSYQLEAESWGWKETTTVILAK